MAMILASRERLISDGVCERLYAPSVTSITRLLRTPSSTRTTTPSHGNCHSDAADDTADDDRAPGKYMYIKHAFVRVFIAGYACTVGPVRSLI